MARNIPKAHHGALQEQAVNGTAGQTIAIGTADWYVWLEQQRSFCFETAHSTFTARKEKRPGGWYWYAYRRKRGKLHTAYLGKAEQLTLERLNTVAAILEQAGEHDAPDSIDAMPLRSPHEEFLQVLFKKKKLKDQMGIAESLSLLAKVDALESDQTIVQNPYEKSLELAKDKSQRQEEHRAIIAVPLSALSAGLTRREHEVLRWLTMGLTNIQIAEHLVVSLPTINTHVRSIYNKLGVTSRSAATRYALEHHLV